MRRLSTPVLFAALGALVLAAPAARADEDLIPPKVLVRHFPQGVFCALPVSISFVTPATDVVVTFTALQFVDDGTGALTWTQQMIDNVTVVPTSEAAPNTLSPPEGSPLEFCYVDDPHNVPFLYFNTAGLTFALKELFDTDPTARGWDFTHGAYYSTARSAPRNPENVDPNDTGGGALGIGDGSDTPVAGLTRSTSIQVSGLSIGQSYDLGAWWYAGFVRFPHDTDYLTVSVTTTGGTPVAKKSWGGLKAKYR